MPVCCNPKNKGANFMRLFAAIFAVALASSLHAQEVESKTAGQVHKNIVQLKETPAD